VLGVVVDFSIDADNRTYKEVKKRNEKEIKEDEYIPADLSRKILNMAHEQQVVVELFWITYRWN